MHSDCVPRSLQSPVYKKLRRLLRGARETAGMTQEQLASSVRRPQSFISKLEGGERHLDVTEFIDVCNALGLSPSSVISELVD
jgi:transcriptional regulator with XRE-family HTH domain